MNLKVVERIIPMLPAQLNYQKKYAERKRKAAVIKTEMNRIIVLNKRQTDRVQTDQIIGSNQEIVRRDVPRKITGLIKDLCKETGPNKVTDQTLRKDQIRGKDQIPAKDLLGTGRMRDQDQNKDRQVKIVRKVTGHKVTVHKGIVLHFVKAVVLDLKINQMKIGERIIAQKVKLSFLKATFNVSRNKYLADIVVCNSKSYSSFVNS
jgi:hypothetical protein